MKQKRKSLFRNIKFGAVMLIIGVIALLVKLIMPKYYFGGLSKAYMKMPTCYSAQGDTKAVCDNYTRIYFVDKNNRVKFFINSDDLGYDGKTEFRQIVLDTDGKLYASAVVINNDAYLTDLALILSFDENGNFIREICRYDYRSEEFPPQKANPIRALNVTENNIRYVYKNDDGSVSLISSSKNDSSSVEEVSLEFGEYNALSTASPAPDGSYAMILVNGDIIRAYPDGTFSTLLKGHFSLDNPENGYLPEDILAFNDHILMIEGLHRKKLYSIYDGEAPKLMYKARDMATAEDDPEDFYWFFFSLYQLNDNVAVDVGGYLTELSESGFIRDNGEYDLPAKYVLLSALEIFLPLTILVCIICGLISVTGCLMKWKMSILSKQLFISLPLIIIMAVMITGSMLGNIRQEYKNQCRLRMEAIIELSTKNLDGDIIEKMTGLECTNDGSLYNLCETMRELINSNTSEWSSKYSCKLFLYGSDGMHFRLASSDGYDTPFTLFISDDGEDIDYTYTSIYDMESPTDSYLCADTPIFNSEGKLVAIYTLMVNTNDLAEDMNTAVKNAVIRVAVLLAVFIAAEVLLTYISGGYLRKAKNAVAAIAGGDFSARIEKSPNDEIGEICTGVNEMARQLEGFFIIKDRNERFYYKFVPEKFRELLHKNEFTDLSLGDAENADLTVLFCDIRAFSLNSEMMTAKENFEFVNKIYGKAGPIIRSHNGFVDKYIGDAVMALFENADDAVNAGMEIYRSIVLDPSTAEELGISSVNIGIGIHSGMARVGIVGEEERMSGTVISNTVNLSSRLESLTKKYNAAMLISKDTLDRMSDPDSLNMRYLGMVQVAGVNEVKAVYEILECLDDERKKERTASKTDFREGVREFHLGHTEKALSIFEQLESVSENDPAPKMYADAIRQKLETGDLEHNVFRFVRK